MVADSEILRPLRFVRGFSIAKVPASPNEDRWATSHDGLTCAVCDGATVSYDPGPWASILAEKFVGNPSVDQDWINRAICEFEKGYDRDELPWMKQAAFDRGSFATLLGVSGKPDGRKAYIFSLGDSLAVIADGNEFLSSFPYTSAEQFDVSPVLLSTSRLHNRLITSDLLQAAVQPVHTAEMHKASLLLMSDALGKWFLEADDKNGAVGQLLEIEVQEQFAGFVEKHRAERRLKRDDTTLLIMVQTDELPEQHRSE